MARREPAGETATEVTIDYVRQLERRLDDLEAYVAGRLPHAHSGATLTSEGEAAGRIIEADGSGGTRWADR